LQGHRAEKISLTKHKSREDERKESPLLLATLDVPRAIPNIYVYLLLIYTVLKVGIKEALRINYLFKVKQIGNGCLWFECKSCIATCHPENVRGAQLSHLPTVLSL
jgi:hypothetical protein